MSSESRKKPQELFFLCKGRARGNGLRRRVVILLPDFDCLRNFHSRIYYLLFFGCILLSLALSFFSFALCDRVRNSRAFGNKPSYNTIGEEFLRSRCLMVKKTRKYSLEKGRLLFIVFYCLFSFFTRVYKLVRALKESKN